MKTNRMKKRLITGGLTAILAAGLVLPASAFAASNTITYTTVPTSYWQNFYNTISWNNIVTQKPVQSGSQGQTTTATQPAKTPTATAGNTSVKASDTQFATQVIALVNQERAKQGLKPLTGHTQLGNMAWTKAKDMSQNGYFDHTSPTYGSPFEMMKKFGISYRYAGENIAMGQKTPAEVVKAWMNSSGHRANIMNPNFTLIGVGYYNGYWAQEFVGK